jgi:chemotaxis protein CheX
MNVEYINPFVESVYELFENMLNSNVKRGEVSLATSNKNTRDIIALIGFSGTVRGNVAISFPVQTALKMVSQLLGLEVKVMDDTVSDAVAELVNIVAGGAKAKFKINKNENQKPIELSLPTVVRGNSFSIDYPRSSLWLEVPFSSGLGDFALRVTFEVSSSLKGGI